MKKGIWSYIISGVLVVSAVVGLLLLLLLPAPKRELLEPVNLYVEDISLDIGQAKTDFYQVSVQDYEISFKTDKDGLIDVDKNSIIANNPGKVKVTVTVTVEDNSIEEAFYVTVLAPSYSYQLFSLSNCTIEGDNLHLSSQTGQFKIKIFDKDGLEIQNPTLSFSSSEGIEVVYEFKMFQVSASKSGSITFTVGQTGYSFTLSVII